MHLNITREVAALKRLTVGQLRARYAEVCGAATNCHNKPWLIKRIAWRLQAQAEGDLSERARRRAAELADDADLRLSPPKVATSTPHTAPTNDAKAVRTLAFQADDRLPPPGTVLTRKYRGEVLQVQVLANRFEFEGQVYPSLSAVAKAITGTHINGFLFFRLGHHGAHS